MQIQGPNKNRLNEMIKSKKLASVVTDGASNMRSTPDHEGPQPNPAGKSFVALLNKDTLTGAKLRDDDTITLALHCLCHIINLAVRDGLAGVPLLQLWWLQHVSIMCVALRVHAWWRLSVHHAKTPLPHCHKCPVLVSCSAAVSAASESPLLRRARAQVQLYQQIECGAQDVQGH